MGFLYLLFFLSGVAGLIYQVIWVRQFGNVFGNTVYSASLVVAIFMLGLGVGSYAMGAWADRRYARADNYCLRAYACIELVIAALGLTISLLLPHLGALSASTSSYVNDSSGWFVPSPSSYVARGVIAVLVLTPMTLLMGGTLTLLIRHRLRTEVSSASGWEVAALYGVNTIGAASGAFLSDFVLIPALGLLRTQVVAVGLNALAGAGAFLLARRGAAGNRVKDRSARPVPATAPARHVPTGAAVVWTSAALALSGFAAMGLEILWLRDFTVLLGGFRSVFSLVLTVMLIGIAAGSILGGAIDRRVRRPALSLMFIQALFVGSVLAGFVSVSSTALDAHAQQLDAILATLTPFARWRAEVWYNLWPILREVGVPSLLMGCAYPLANAVIQDAEQTVGRRAGGLYLANTVGAVCGSLVAGYVLLPLLGIQTSVTTLTIVGATAIVPFSFATRHTETLRARSAASPIAGLLIVTIGLGLWLQLPRDYILRRSLPASNADERTLAVSEGVSEVVVVTEAAGRGRALMTNGHPMSSTALLDQRYMRALAHIPLLSMEHEDSGLRTPDSGPGIDRRPSGVRSKRVLVIGFGVGNTTEAASLHPSVQRIDVADLSREVLAHATYFRDANHDVLADRRVSVFVNDGRQHLQMQPAETYDLITLEPPPIAHAGVAALYSRDFYALARSRLKAGGYLSQWLPAYQVPVETTLAMTRAFLEVFPQSVLLSGTQAELLLVGTTASRIEIDPARIAQALGAAPQVTADLQRLDLGTPTEIVGTFVGSAQTLGRATAGALIASDDRPLQEYGVRSMLGAGLRGVPASLFDLSAIGSWCPACFDGEQPTAPVAGLDAYLGLLTEAYRSPAAGTMSSARTYGQRRLLGSAYLGALVPDTAAVHNIVGVTHLREGRFAEAARLFREALDRDGGSIDATRNLGTALGAMGRRAEAIEYLQRAVQLDPQNGGAQEELGSLLLETRDYAAAAQHLEAAVRLLPSSAALHNDLGVALASMGRRADAVPHFQQAIALEPGFAEARRNLDAALPSR